MEPRQWHTGMYLDDARLISLDDLEELDVSLYLHPGIPTDQPASMVEELRRNLAGQTTLAIGFD